MFTVHVDYITYNDEVGNFLISCVSQLKALPNRRIIVDGWSALRGIRIAKVGRDTCSRLI